MDQYSIVTTLNDHSLASAVCDHLERAGIGVMLEHVEVRNGEDSSTGFRLLVPSSCSQRARLLVENAIRTVQSTSVIARPSARFARPQLAPIGF